MSATLNIDWYLLFVLLGLFQAFFLSIMLFIKSRKSGRRFAFLGVFIFALALILSEVFLDYSGYILNVIAISKFSLPAQFLLAPSIYLFIHASLHAGRPKRIWPHYLLFIFILGYFFLYYFQDNAVKYNHHIDEYNLVLEHIPGTAEAMFDPFRIHYYIHFLVFGHLLFYGIFIGRYVGIKYRSSGIRWLNNNHSYINQYRNLFFFYVIAVLILLVLLINYFHLGDFLFSIYLTAIIYLVSINISFRSLNNYYQQKQKAKYAHSLISEEEKSVYLEKIMRVIEDEKFYSGSNASLDELSSRTKIPKHKVSQVINDSMDKSFFTYLAECRIKKAKQLLKDPKFQNITIDEISFMVGYNSRSAFNKVFKSSTGQTPADYRSSAG